MKMLYDNEDVGFVISQNAFQVLAQTCHNSMAQRERFDFLKSLIFRLLME